MMVIGFIRNFAAVSGIALVLVFTITQLYAGTLDDIIKRGKLHIGVLTGGPPMGMIDENGKPAGYDVDVANLLGKYIGLPVEVVPLTPPSRIPALLTGKVDFLVATLAPTGERARTVMFTQPYNAFHIEIVSKESQRFENLDQLKGKRVATNRGSTQESALRNARVEGMEIVLYEDDSTAVQAFLSGQVDAIVMPSTLTEILRKQLSDTGLHGFTFYEQGNAMATKMGDFDVLQWLNTAIYIMKSTGDLDVIAKRWTGRPMADLPNL